MIVVMAEPAVSTSRQVEVSATLIEGTVPPAVLIGVSRARSP